ncbi:MAG: YraN family protein [Patescibacteria group bacterium]
MKNTYSTREKGNRGEDIACQYLEGRGFFIQERNHLRKWGEIDIIAIKDDVLHFVEVKSIIHSGVSGYRPEENVHAIKQKKLRRVIQTYLNETRYDKDAEFQFHVISVIHKGSMGKPEVKMLENVIL